MELGYVLYPCYVKDEIWNKVRVASASLLVSSIVWVQIDIVKLLSSAVIWDVKANRFRRAGTRSMTKRSVFFCCYDPISEACFERSTLSAAWYNGTLGSRRLTGNWYTQRREALCGIFVLISHFPMLISATSSTPIPYSRLNFAKLVSSHSRKFKAGASCFDFSIGLEAIWTPWQLPLVFFNVLLCKRDHRV
jgi:hypothetical protein